MMTRRKAAAHADETETEEDPRIARCAEAALDATGVSGRFAARHEEATSEEEREQIAAHAAGTLGAARNQAMMFLAMYDAVTAKGEPKKKGHDDDDDTSV